MLLAQLQADLDRFRDLALRCQADFENFRKRSRPRKRGGREVRQRHVSWSG